MANEEKPLTAVEVRVLKASRPNAGFTDFYKAAECKALVDLTKRGLLQAKGVIGREGKDIYYYTTKLGKALLKKYLSR